jgi:hypothetical protein
MLLHELRNLIETVKWYILMLCNFQNFLILLVRYIHVPKRLGNRKRKFERDNFVLTFSRFTDKEFKTQTSLSRRSFNFLLYKIQQIMPKKVFLINVILII